MGIPATMKFAPLVATGATAAVMWPGGRGSFVAYGTFGGGTAALQWSPDDGTTWINVDQGGSTYVTLTANSEGGFELPQCQVRVNLTGATSPTINSGVQSVSKSA
jgi:hypothetical protein